MSRSPRILVTGFGRFPGAPINPTGPLAHALVRSRRPALARLDRKARVLETCWAEIGRLDALLAAEQPDIVLMLGLAARRRQVCVELRAVDMAGGPPDAARQRGPERILAGGPRRAYRCAAAPMPLLHALRQAGVPARLSRDAGRYLCNALACAVYFRAKTLGRPQLAAFVHIPRPDRAGMAPGALLRGLEGVLIALAAQLRAYPSR